MKVWLVVAVVGVITVCLKGAGPVVLGSRRLMALLLASPICSHR